MLISIISFLIIFTLIALVHEGGHFLAAKKAGMRIPECGIGFGPKLWSFKKGDTTYTINLIPILAYVNIAGMEETKEDENLIPQDQLYFSKPPLARLLMAFFGPFMNIVLAFIILSILFAFMGVPKSISNVIDQVQKNSIAEKSGIKPGDQVIEINAQKVISMEAVIGIIHKSADKPIALKIKRGNEILTIKATPMYNPKLKVALMGFSPKAVYSKVDPLSAIYYGAQQTYGMIILMFAILWQLITGAVSLGDLAGPVGIAQITGKYANSGIFALLQFTAFLNVNIGVLNLLPLPALDGGHIIFAIIEIVTKRRVKEETQRKVHMWGLYALLAIMLLVTINDILRIALPK